MPPFEPASLFQSCVKQCVKTLNDICESLARKHITYDVHECKDGVAAIKEFLLENEPGCLLDWLYEEWRKLKINYDGRIGTAALMHEHMRRFRIRVDHPESHLYSDVSFWTKQLPSCNSIVMLDFNLMCTDEILKTIGQHCPLLEYINATSQVIFFNVDKCTSKYKGMVTEQGLLFLEKCQMLKYLLFLDDSDSQYFERISEDTVRRLTKKLPKIKFISYNNMGVVITINMEEVIKLSLTNIIEHTPKPEHIKEISRLCPNVLSLTLCSNWGANEDYIKNKQNIPLVLDKLCNSDLHLSMLTINKLEPIMNVYNFFIFKGLYVHELVLNISTLPISLVQCIGQYCTNLRLLSCQETFIPDTYETLNLEFELPKEAYCKLHSLTLRGLRWDYENILMSTVTNAVNLKKLEIKINNNNFTDTANNLFQRIMVRNPLSHVEHLYLECFLKTVTIYSFLCLPCVKSLYFLKNEHFVSETDQNMLNYEAKINNVKLWYTTVS